MARRGAEIIMSGSGGEAAGRHDGRVFAQPPNTDVRHTEENDVVLVDKQSWITARRTALDAAPPETQRQTQASPSASHLHSEICLRTLKLY